MATTSKIRNVALIGHAGEGKTTLTEAILFNLKAIDRQGKVDDGNTVSDFDPEEIARKTSISLSVAYGDYNGVKFNILDVPGFFDFEGEMVQALSVADGAVVVTGASGALTDGTELALDYCLKNDIPTMIYYPRCLHQQKAFAGRTFSDADYRHSIDATKRCLSLPIYPYLKEEETDRICEIMLTL